MSSADPSGLSEEEVSHVIGMAWKDDVPFEAIEARYGVDEEAVVARMRRRLKPSSWKLWRERVQNRATKHAARCSLTDSVSRRPPGALSIGPLDSEEGLDTGTVSDDWDPEQVSTGPANEVHAPGMSRATRQ